MRGERLSSNNKSKKLALSLEQASILVQKYRPFVQAIAYKLAPTFPSFIDVEDLISVGCIGLLEAATRYDSTLNVPFKQFAVFRIRGAMLDELRRQDFLPRRARQQFKKICNEIERVEKTKGKRPSNSELATSTNIPKEKIEKLRNSPLFIYCSGMEKSDNIMQERLMDDTGSPQTDPYEFTVFQDIQLLMAEALKNMSDMEQTLMRMYYFEGKGLKEIGVYLGLSESRISQLRTKGLLRLRNLLRSSLKASEIEELLAA